MDTAARDTIHAELERERDRLRAELVALGHGGPDLQFDEGFADSGQVTAERGEVEALAGALEATLAEVEHALSKAGSAAYGTCEGCGDEIAEDRLEANPAARQCFACASKRR
jgi:RNA polymerase-binding transcription factor DksA